MFDVISSRETMRSDPLAWRELYRCDDLRAARAVATSIAAMEFDVRLCSIHPRAGDAEPEHDGDVSPAAFVLRAGSGEPSLPGPHVIEVREESWPRLAEVLPEIIAEQQEFDERLEVRRDRQRVRIVIILSLTTAAEVVLIWRLLEG